jgi:hypothetical protein
LIEPAKRRLKAERQTAVSQVGELLRLFFCQEDSSISAQFFFRFAIGLLDRRTMGSPRGCSRWVGAASGDQLQWSGAHAAIIESVRAPVVQGDLTTYTLTISQYNGGGNNEYGTYQTTFAVRGRTVAALPRFRNNGSGATSYYR